MNEKYRLVFRGEILEGQHRAVVKRRLMELMKLSEAQTEKLFSGSPVTVKRDVDKKTAARYQMLFKQAGGQLRVLAQQTALTSAQDSALASGSAVAQSAGGAEAPAAEGAAFTVETAYFPPPAEPPMEIDAPDYDIAAVGANLLDEVEAEAVIVPEVNFELAEVGVDILTARPAAVVADVRDVDFDLAEVGVTLGVESAGAPPVAPDISHLQIVEN
jgi:hypothetical protein